MKAALTKIRRGARPALAFAWAGLALLLVLGAPRARAQSEGQDGPRPPRRESGARRHGRGHGESLMRRLNLTPEQHERLSEIRRQSEPEARELTRRLRLARRALEEAIYSDTLDEARIEEHARALTEAQAALVRLRAATELKVRRVLTPEQLGAFRELRQQAQRRQVLQRRMRGGARPRPPEPAGEDPADADAPRRPPRAHRRGRP